MAKNTVDVNDLLDDIETVVQTGCRKAGFIENDGEEYEARASVEALITGDEKPTDSESNKLAMKILLFYCSQDIAHNHIEKGSNKGDLNISSIKADWQKKLVRSVANKIEASWDKLNNGNNSSEAKPMAKRGRKPGGTLKERTIARGKRVGMKVLVKKASRNVAAAGQQLVVGLLTSNANFNDPGFKEKVGLLLSTPYGQAAVGLFLSVAVDHIPGLPEDLKEALQDQMQEDAFDQFSMPIEDLVKSALPMLGAAIAPLLTSGSGGGDIKQFAPTPAVAPSPAPTPVSSPTVVVEVSSTPVS